jgi:hypothetical protein
MGVLSHAPSSVLFDLAAAPLPASASSLDTSQSQQEGGALTTVPAQASSLLFGTVSGESQRIAADVLD